jgi:hypothetical protein
MPSNTNTFAMTGGFVGKKLKYLAVVHPLNALDPMLVTPEGIVMEYIA